MPCCANASLFGGPESQPVSTNILSTTTLLSLYLTSFIVYLNGPVQLGLDMIASQNFHQYKHYFMRGEIRRPVCLFIGKTWRVATASLVNICHFTVRTRDPVYQLFFVGLGLLDVAIATRIQNKVWWGLKHFQIQRGSGLVWSTQRGCECMYLRLWPFVVLDQWVAIVWWSVFDLNFTAVRSQNFGFGHMPFLIWPCRGIGPQWQGPWEESTGHYYQGGGWSRIMSRKGSSPFSSGSMVNWMLGSMELGESWNFVQGKDSVCALCLLGWLQFEQSPWRDLSALDSTSVMLESSYMLKCKPGSALSHWSDATSCQVSE